MDSIGLDYTIGDNTGCPRACPELVEGFARVLCALTWVHAEYIRFQRRL